MTDSKTAIESMASDLKRAALGLQRKSLAMSECFLKEAINRVSELNLGSLPEYIKQIIQKIEIVDVKKAQDRMPEDFLMYSVLLQNYAIRLTQEV